MALKVTPLLNIQDLKDSVALVEKVMVGGLPLFRRHFLV